MHRPGIFTLVLAIAVFPPAFTACSHDGSSGGSKIEQAVLAHLRSTQDGAKTASVSCTNDHRLRVAGKSAVAVRCIPHGGHLDGIETCLIFEGERLLGAKELAAVSHSDRACRNQA
jgi:hypothetical protein